MMFAVDHQVQSSTRIKCRINCIGRHSRPDQAAVYNLVSVYDNFVNLAKLRGRNEDVRSPVGIDHCRYSVSDSRHIQQVDRRFCVAQCRTLGIRHLPSCKTFIQNRIRGIKITEQGIQI
ncbi:MAG: hypothetical protein FIB06_04885 [Betaproteobacteria bacterium]|nr:hypothetical protein [Betaproteobacteria bacterium]